MHWGVDVYGGIGLRLRNIATSNEEYNDKRNSYTGGIDLNIFDMRMQTDATPGRSATGNITLGARFCYRF